ncbi:MAG: hypothetical protein HY753_07610 [Nitrospirae bacterium]|nr:hypothetical protein [Nitrospirota bacterium]
MKTNRTSHIAHRFFLFYCLLLLGFSFAAYQRNMAWRDELTLWEDVVKKIPALQDRTLILPAVIMAQGRYKKLSANIKPH